MHWIDWMIVVLLVGGITAVAFGTKKYMRSVADFLSANRCAGKYLLGVADGMAGLGAVSIIAMFEMGYKAGFTATWWQMMLFPISMIIASTGWVQYRFRQTRALTMAQFFEMRYNRSFRVFAGMLGFVSGIINFGIFPAVGGRFFQYYCGLPSLLVELGGTEIDLIYAAVMAVLLVISLGFTFLGGQIAVMVTDFIQGMFVTIVFVLLGFYMMFFLFDWQVVIDTLVRFAPADASMVNPMKTGGTENFNLVYFMIASFVAFYAYMAWQGGQGYNSSARSPHEARMGRVVGQLRSVTQTLPLVLLPVCAFVFMHHPGFADRARGAHDILAGIGNEQLSSQVTVTVAISHFLPIGLLGLFAAVMLAAFISTHDTYLHSWGTIFIQDIVMPVRQRFKGDDPVPSKVHIRWLRSAIAGVCIFVFLFSLLFNQKQDIYMFFALTGTVYLGWAGSAIIGGLYWKRGTAKGAWTSAILSVLLAVGGWFLIYQWESSQTLFVRFIPELWASLTETWPALLGDKCPVNAQVLFFWTIAITILTYVVVSLIDGKVFDMDQLLHRGKYAVEDDVAKAEIAQPKRRRVLFGKEFSLGDRIMVIVSYAYILLFFALFLIGTIYMLSTDIPDAAWGEFWRVFSIIILLMTTVVTVWVCIGGVKNLRELFSTLRTLKRDAHDDGTVVGHRNLDDLDREG